jgi:hypothetical protein
MVFGPFDCSVPGEALRVYKIIPAGERLAGKYKPDTNGCWIWTGGKFNHGYGAIGAGSKQSRQNLLAHRVSYEHYKGPIPEGLDVCHTCDVKLCINPEHLFVGTAKDNVRDMYQKGRERHRRQKESRLFKYEDEQIEKMRKAYASGMTQKDAGALVGMSQSHASFILGTGLRWRSEITAARKAARRSSP